MSVLRVVSVERGASTPPAVRSPPRSAHGRCGGVAKGRPHVWWTEQTRGGVCSIHHTCGHLLSPSCQDSSRRPWSGRSTSPAVRSVPRSARGRRGGVAKGRPQGARSCGGPNRRAERLCPPVGVGTLVNAGRGFHVQHSLNVPALVGTASSDVRMFPAQRAPRSGPRRAPGGNTPHPVTSA